MSKGTMQIMDVKEGDIKVEWNPDNEEEAKQVEKTFKEMTGKGFLAFRMSDDWEKSKALTEFDKYCEKILLIPPIVGG